MYLRNLHRTVLVIVVSGEVRPSAEMQDACNVHDLRAREFLGIADKVDRRMSDMCTGCVYRVGQHVSEIVLLCELDWLSDFHTFHIIDALYSQASYRRLRYVIGRIL